MSSTCSPGTMQQNFRAKSRWSYTTLHRIMGNSQDRYDAEVADGAREKETEAAVPVQSQRVNRGEEHRRQKFRHSQSQL